ncbi:MAG: hypothetical protein APF76_14025 [Desulfitibacter sp. BRH_c19]|nr:MAG: hypothetical protein APF76_14025 [Desulfitibacter sp. BRH_c19]
MIRDKILLGIFIGFLADASKLIFNYIAFKLTFTNLVFWQLIAALLLEKDDIHKPSALLIGSIADITVSILLGVIFIYVIYFIGKEYLWIKGIGFGMLVWVSLFGVLLAQLIQGKISQDPSGILVTIVAHFIFGLSLAFFTWLLARNMTLFHEELKKLIGDDRKAFKLLKPHSLKKLLDGERRGFKKPKKI